MNRQNGEERKLEERLEDIVGMEEIKKYIHRLQKRIPILKQWKEKDLFPSEHILLSIHSGHGASLVAELIAEFYKEAEIFQTYSRGLEKLEIKEIYFKRSSTKNIPDTYYLNEMKGEITQYNSSVYLIHMESWKYAERNAIFQEFLKHCKSNGRKNIFIFVVPYQEVGELSYYQRILEEFFHTVLLRVSPYTKEQYVEVIEKKLKDFNIESTESARPWLYHRILLEKQDGKFYGMKTIDKIVTEIVLLKARKTKGKMAHYPLLEEDFREFMEGDTFGNQQSGEEQLQALIGQEGVKQKIKEMMISLQAQKQAQQMEEKSTKLCYHMMFTGNPGTGKTEIARILGKMMKEHSLLSVGDLLEVGRFDLVSEFLGQTGPKTKAVCKSAYGSILFIDEAYLLAPLENGDPTKRDFGIEAIGTLITEMESNRDNLVIVFAGYEDKMEKLLATNPGLKGRIPHHVHFPNYTKEELYLIFVKMMQEKFQTEEAVWERAKSFFDSLQEEVLKEPEFGNARFVRNLVERVQMKALIRQYGHGVSTNEALYITEIDFKNAVDDEEMKSLNQKNKKPRIGFEGSRIK